MEEIELPGLGRHWTPKWSALAARLTKHKHNLGLSRENMRKILKLADRKGGEEERVKHVHGIGDIVPSNSCDVTDLEFHCVGGERCVQDLCYYLSSLELWPSLKYVRVFKLVNRPFKSIILHTPIVNGYGPIVDGQRKWDKQLAFKRRVLSAYSRDALYVVETTMYQLEDDLMKSTIGMIVSAERDMLEYKDGLKLRFAKNEEGIVSEVRLLPGFVINDEVAPVIAYSPNAVYRLWDIKRIVFIPASLQNEERFMEMCSRLRAMVVADAYFCVLLLDFFIGGKGKGGSTILGSPPPVFKSPMIKYRDHHFRQQQESFVEQQPQQPLIRTQGVPNVPVKNRLGGFPVAPPSSKRIFTGGPLATTFTGRE